jgi:hypothetical protein
MVPKPGEGRAVNEFSGISIVNISFNICHTKAEKFLAALVDLVMEGVASARLFICGDFQTRA